MPPGEPYSIFGTVLVALQYAVLIPLVVSAGLATWRAVTDARRGASEATGEAGQGTAGASALTI